MKNMMLAGAALLALSASPHLAQAQTMTAVPSLAGSSFTAAAAGAIAIPRSAQGMWVSGQTVDNGTDAFLQVLRRGQLDGLASGPALAARAEGLIQRARGGDSVAAAEADQLLSTAFVRYVEALHRRTPGMEYADRWAAPRQLSPAQILATAAAAPSLAHHVAEVSEVNPIYAKLRDAAWAEMQATGATPDRRVLESLDRVRNAPFQSRYIIVDAASANLWMIEDGNIVDTMPVITGKAEHETPMIASTIYHATLNPYWNVPADLTRSMIAPRVIEQGVNYLTERDYEVLTGFGDNPQTLDPTQVDWKAVADGTESVRLRRKPGEWNSMGRMKFGFANGSDIFLHDTPNKELFGQDDRNLSYGCIRLADAPRLAKWLLGREPNVNDIPPEQHVALPTPVPVYITYLTARPNGQSIAFADDVYGRDSTGARTATRVAGLR